MPATIDSESNPINGLTFAPEWAGTNIFLCCQPVALQLDSLFAAERAVVDNASDIRQRTFSSGRCCAREALAEAGLEGVELPRLDDGSVSWPDGITGSLSHTNDWAVAAIAISAMSNAVALGIDLEQIKSLEEGVIKLIATNAEIAELKALDTPDWQATALFSFKESVYKCLARPFGQFIQFQDVQITALATGRPHIEFMSDALAACFDEKSLELRMAVTSHHVFTLVWQRG